jgi:5S rRNA maturation endonuclease (ribonuclease M5)
MTIAQIKEKYTCIDLLGEPSKKTKNGYLYHAPWRTDTHESLSVTPNGKGWNDLATGEHGSVIDLAMMILNTKDVKMACEYIEKKDPSFFFSQPINDCGQKEKEISFTRFDVMPITSRGLYGYLHRRGINIDIAKQFLVEAHYSYRNPDDGSYIYTLAYKNDKGGYELRNAAKKLSKSPKGITTHIREENAPTVVFEGFFDMLSFATLCGGIKHNYIVLNSIVNKDAAINVLRSMTCKVFLCLDNDNGGDETTQAMINALPSAIDIRNKFAPCKDLNEYLTKKE